MPRRALIERRPWLLGSVIFAVSWWLIVRDSEIPGLYAMAWKAAPLFLLGIYALRRHLGLDGVALVVALFLAAIADALSVLTLPIAPVLMALSFACLIALFLRNRRQRLRPSQRILAILLVPVLPLIAWLALPSSADRPAYVALVALAAVMAAMGWTSSFSRYRVGIGCVLVVTAHVLELVVAGAATALSPTLSLVVWPAYFAGQLMIATGVVAAFRHQAD